MTEKKKQIETIKGDFQGVQSVLNVVGDETRQLILLVLMEIDCDRGIRVGDITARTHLSRPAVSHQLRILKDEGIVRCRPEGTMNFYYIDVSHNKEMIGRMKKLVGDIEDYMKLLEEK